MVANPQARNLIGVTLAPGLRVAVRDDFEVRARVRLASDARWHGRSELVSHPRGPGAKAVPDRVEVVCDDDELLALALEDVDVVARDLERRAHAQAPRARDLRDPSGRRFRSPCTVTIMPLFSVDGSAVLVIW